MRSWPAAGAEAGTQVRPGFTELVLVERRLAVARQDALGGHAGGDACKPRLVGGITPFTGIEVDFDVEDGKAGAFHQPHLGAAGLLPLLDGQGSQCGNPTTEGQRGDRGAARKG
jgi:hypothetical protein